VSPKTVPLIAVARPDIMKIAPLAIRGTGIARVTARIAGTSLRASVRPVAGLHRSVRVPD
jgi:hypothetical protein